MRTSREKEKGGDGRQYADAVANAEVELHRLLLLLLLSSTSDSSWASHLAVQPSMYCCTLTNLTRSTPVPARVPQKTRERYTIVLLQHMTRKERLILRWKVDVHDSEGGLTSPLRFVV